MADEANKLDKLDEADEAHATNEAVVLDVAIEANTVDGANKAN